jgi:predicted nucleic acid-binding protein
VLDTMLLSHFTLADRLDVLQDLLVGTDSWTTQVVIEELRTGAKAHPELVAACEVDWLKRAELDTLYEIRCFTTWARRLGSADRNLGEASVLAAAQLRHGIAITDDRQATKVARAHHAEVHGTVWLLAASCRTGKQTLAGAGNLIDALRATSARLPCSGAEFPAYARQHRLL